ncbi:MAG: hypothetical protein WC365_08920 [Candidatus Babeliales bacterium]|jgi:hypothetical protein
MTNDEFEKKYQTSVLMAGKELAILRKVNADLLEAMETIFCTTTCITRSKEIAQSAINGAANDMRFGISEKKEGE